MNDFSYMNNADSAAIEGLYEEYLNDPLSVDESWRKFFEGFQENIVTKVILIIFFAFLISQILGLFKINYNRKSY